MKTLYGLSAGKIKLKNGETTHFNVLENNTPEDTLVLISHIGRNDKTTYTVVAGSGRPESYSSYCDNGMVNMQSQGRNVKVGTGRAAYPNTLESLHTIKNIVGKSKCSFWVFK